MGSEPDVASTSREKTADVRRVRDESSSRGGSTPRDAMTIPRASPGSVLPRAAATAGIGLESSPASLFGIPLGVLASVCAVGAYYVLEHPERRQADLVPARREVRLALERAGFFTNFGFIASAAVAIELAAGRGVSNTWRWRLLISYVASNHALYFAHTATGTGACPEASTGAGAGAMLAASDRGFLRRLFDEHRLADVIVHAGGVVASRGRRLDHLVSLVEHLRRYAGVAPRSRRRRRRRVEQPPQALDIRDGAYTVHERRWFGRRFESVSFSVADLVDVVAHARTASKTLSLAGPPSGSPRARRFERVSGWISSNITGHVGGRAPRDEPRTRHRQKYQVEEEEEKGRRRRRRDVEE